MNQASQTFRMEYCLQIYKFTVKVPHTRDQPLTSADLVAPAEMLDPSVINPSNLASLAAVSPVAVRGVIHIQSKWRGDRVRDELVWSDSNGEDPYEDINEIPRGNTQESIKASSQLDSYTVGTNCEALQDDSLVTPAKQGADSTNNSLVAAAVADTRKEPQDGHATELQLRAQLAKTEEARQAAVREAGKCACVQRAPRADPDSALS